MNRYAIRDDDCAVEHTHGDWVRHEDAVAEITLARQIVEVARATGIIRELLWDIRLARRVIGVPYSLSVQQANAWLEEHDAH